MGRAADPFTRYPVALRIACPLCSALPCQPCVSARGQRSEQPHKARVTVATTSSRRHAGARAECEHGSTFPRNADGETVCRWCWAVLT